MPHYNITWGNLYWPYFLILTSLTFGVPELIAVCTNKANTLSIYSQSELGEFVGMHGNIHSLAWWLSLAAWLLFVVVITQHIWWRHIYIP